MSITLENQINSIIDRLCDIKSLLQAGKVPSALLNIRSLECSLYQTLAIQSLEHFEQQHDIEEITCKDYPPLVLVSNK